MSTKYELPLLMVSKPSQHWAIKALWMAGGVLGVQMLLVGAFVWKRTTATQTPAPVAKAAAPAAPQAKAPAPAQNAPVALATTTAAAPDVATAPEAAAAAKAAPKQHRSVRSGRASSSKHVLAARTTTSSSSAAATRPSPSKDRGSDAIDDLLKKFK